MAEGDGEALAWLDELVEQIRRLHTAILDTSGGLHGEQAARLYAVCARPFRTAFGDEVYLSNV